VPQELLQIRDLADANNYGSRDKRRTGIIGIQDAAGLIGKF
jgi:hypothetical protein